MRDTWTYEENLRIQEASVIGYDVEATDGGIGKVDQDSLEADAEHLVVDTGFWIFGKKRLIPAGAVRDIDHENELVHVHLTKDQIRDAPDWTDESTFDPSSQAAMSNYYMPLLWPDRRS